MRERESGRESKKKKEREKEKRTKYARKILVEISNTYLYMPNIPTLIQP